MTKEYRVVLLQRAKQAEDALNYEAAQGFELVSIVQPSSTVTGMAIMERGVLDPNINTITYVEYGSGS